MLEDYAAHLLGPRPGHRPPAEGRRRRRQRDGRAHRPRRARPPGPRPSCRCTTSSTAPSRTTRPTPSSRPTWPTSRQGAGDRRRHRPRLRRRRRPLLHRRRARRDRQPVGAHRADRRRGSWPACPGSTVIHNLITSRAVPELVTRLGGTPVRTRVGHSFIKATMAETDAIFGGEHSGHFYFRDFWRADSGMLAALHVLAALAETDRPLSDLLAEYSSLRRDRRDQLHGRRPGRRRRRDRAGVRRPRRRHAGPPRRAHRHPPRLVVQCPRVQHRAAAAAERGGRRPGHARPAARRRARHDQE